DAKTVQAADPTRVAYLTQTTLSVDDTLAIVEVLRRRFPSIRGPRKDDICYATQNRQSAVKDLARSCSLILVVGSRESSNSSRLVEVARAAGARAHLVNDAGDVDPSWLRGCARVGVTSGASTPESLVGGVLDRIRQLGPIEVSELRTATEEVTFPLPVELRGTP
ncbi:MAG: 4-hydroxy-3-methylbut-2-enyl diphosphate reductase, partial [Myxococcota bacterium]